MISQIKNLRAIAGRYTGIRIWRWLLEFISLNPVDIIPSDESERLATEIGKILFSMQ